METGEAIRLIVGFRGFTQGELAERTGLARVYVNQVINGKVRRPGVENLLKLAQALEVPIDLLDTPPRSKQALLNALELDKQRNVLVGDRPPSTTRLRRIPIVEPSEFAQAGWDAQRLLESSKEFAPGISEDPDAFYLAARGEELTGPRIFHPGSLLLIEPNKTAKVGDYVIVDSDHGPCLRRLREMHGSQVLATLHDLQHPVVFRSRNQHRWRIKTVMVDPYVAEIG